MTLLQTTVNIDDTFVNHSKKEDTVANHSKKG